MVLPGVVLGFLAFRGLRNDQALQEKQALMEAKDFSAGIFRIAEQQLPELPDSLLYLSLILDEAGIQVPICHRLAFFPDDFSGNTEQEPVPEFLINAEAAEFSDGGSAQAEAGFRLAASDSLPPETRARALLALARLLAKTDRTKEAGLVYRQMASDYDSILTPDRIPVAALAMLGLSGLRVQIGDDDGARRVADSLAGFLTDPPVRIPQSVYEFLCVRLEGLKFPPGRRPAERLTEARDRSVFLCTILKTAESFFQSGSGGMRYLESARFPALFVRTPDAGGRPAGKVIDMASWVRNRFPSYMEQADPSGRYEWAVIGGAGELVAGSRRVQGKVAVSFPDYCPGWKLSLEPVGRTGLAGLFNTSRGLFILVFAFIIVVMATGLAFMLRTLSQEMKLSRMKSDFIANVSHEFKTPLTSIRHMTEIMLLKRIQSENRKEQYLQSMLEQCDYLGHLIGNILDFSRIEEDIRSFRFESADPGQLLQELVQIFRSRIPDPDFEISYSSDGEPVRIMIDWNAMMQVFYNLLDNAYKYSGGSRKIELGLTTGDGVVVRVRDFGLGIPEKDLPRIFERFYRGDKLRTEGIKGSGIGLTIVRRIVEAHGGTIRVESRVGQGSLFTVKLPLNQTREL